MAAAYRHLVSRTKLSMTLQSAIIRILLLVGALLPSPSAIAVGLGAQVAKGHVSFAREISASGLRLSTDFADVAAKVEDNWCSLSKSDANEMDETTIRLARRYASDYCRPWLKMWDRALGPCDKERAPSWCDDEAATLERLDLEAYFTTMISGLRSSVSSLERDNITDIVLGVFNAEFIASIPDETKWPWALQVVTTYLEHASGEQANELARSLNDTWIGLPPPIVAAFFSYIQESDMLTRDERESLETLLEQDPGQDDDSR